MVGVVGVTGELLSSDFISSVGAGPEPLPLGNSVAPTSLSPGKTRVGLGAFNSHGKMGAGFW